MSDENPRPRLRRTGLVPAGIAGAGLAAAAGALAWLLLTPSGAQFALEQALGSHGGKVSGVEGRLAGPLSVATLQVDAPAVRLRASRIALDWSPARLARGELRLESLRVADLDIETPPSSEPLQPPTSLALPVTVVVQSSRIDRLRLATAGESGPGTVLRELGLQGVADKDAWTVSSAQAATPWGDVKASGRLGAASPFGLDLRGEIAGTRDGAAYRVALAGKGSLSRIEAEVAGSEGEPGRGGKLSGQASAVVEPFARQPLRQLVAKLEGVDLAGFAKAPRTNLLVEADLVPRDGALLAGAVAITNRDAGPWDRGRLPITSAGATVRLEGERLDIRGARLQLPGGGDVRGDATWREGKLEARVTVRDADLLALHTALRPTKLSGTLEAAVSGEAQTFTVALFEPRFSVSGEARIAEGTLTLKQARLARGRAVAEGRGTIRLSGDRAFTAEGRVANLDPAAFAAVPAGDLNGVFNARGRFAKALALEGRADLSASRYGGLAAGGHAALAVQDGRLSMADVDLAVGASRLEAKGSLGAAGDTLQVRVNAPDLGPLGRAFNRDLGGRIALDGSISGVLASPAVRASLESAGLRLPGGVRVATLKGAVDIAAGESGVATGTIAMTGLAGAGEKDAWVERATLALKGTRSAHELRVEAALPDKTHVRALLDGGLQAGERLPAWRGRLESLDTAGVVTLSLAVPAPLAVSAEQVELGEATLAGETGRITLDRTRWTSAALETRGSLSGLFARSVTRLLGLPGRTGSTLVMAGEWDLRVGASVDGRLAFHRERGDVRVGEPRQALGLDTVALRADADGGRVRAVLEVRGRQAGQWQADVTAQLRRGDNGWEIAPAAPMAGRFRVDVADLAWMAAWIGPEAMLGGRLAGEGELGGSAREPAWQGRLEATGLKLRDPVSGADVTDGSIAVAFRDREARLERFVLSAPWRPDAEAAQALASARPASPGQVTGEGAMDLGTRRGTLRVKAEAFPLTRLATRFLVVSGEGRATLDGSQTLLAGDFRADAGWFGIPASLPPALSDDVIVDRGDPAATEAKASAPLRLDLRLALGDHLHFVGRGVTTRLAGALRLEGEAGPNLRATGTIRAVGGSYDAYGNRLALERGALNFVGPVDNPGLNILALRKGLPVEAGVEITGTVNRPKARLVSSPDVPDPEKLSWLVLGRSGQGEVSAADAALLVSTANAVLGREGPAASRIISGLGLDEIRIAQHDGSTLGTLPESTVAGKTGAASAAEVLTVGKRLTDEIYVSYRQSLADAEGSLRVAWQLTKGLQVILQAGDRPGVDAVYRFSLDRVPTLVK